MNEMRATMVGALATVVVFAKEKGAAAAAVGVDAIKDFDAVIDIAEGVRDAIANGAEQNTDGSTWSEFRAVAQAFDILTSKYPRTELASIAQNFASAVRRVMQNAGVREAADGRLILP